MVLTLVYLSLPSYVEGYFSEICVEEDRIKSPTRCISASRLARNKIDGYHHFFIVKLSNGAISNTVRCNRKSEIQNVGWNNVENMGVAFEILLLSLTRAEIYFDSYLLAVNGRHLWFTIYRDVWKYPTSLSVVPDPENIGIAIGISWLSRTRTEIDVIFLSILS